MKAIHLPSYGNPAQNLVMSVELALAIYANGLADYKVPAEWRL
jgi:hypothetical protein